MRAIANITVCLVLLGMSIFEVKNITELIGSAYLYIGILWSKLFFSGSRTVLYYERFMRVLMEEME